MLSLAARGRAGLPSQDWPPNALLDLLFARNRHKRKAGPVGPHPGQSRRHPGVERVLKEGGSRGLSSGGACKVADGRPTPTGRRAEAKGLGQHEAGNRAWALGFLQQIASPLCTLTPLV